jgi:potassium-transporting ATPase ATP-binding subunit
MAAAALLRNNLWIYGAGGIVVPFLGIKMIDIIITHIGLA